MNHDVKPHEGKPAMRPDQQHKPPKLDPASDRTVEEALATVEELMAKVGYTAKKGGYPIVDTAQTTFFSNDAIIDAPAPGQPFYGQDAQFPHNPPSYTNNGDGTTTDNVTGLMWIKDPGAKKTWIQSVEYLKTLNEEGFAGHHDWRIPTVKEVFSLVNGMGVTAWTSQESVPYIDTDNFVFTYGDAAGESRFIDTQITSTSIYGATTMQGNTTMFGYNFADGRIKGYPINKAFCCHYVRANTNYGQNLYVDNGNDTITDEATSLMWAKHDSGFYKAGEGKDGSFNWEESLAYAQEMNAQNFLGYSDWRLPNIKELQSLTDYSNSPAVTGRPAIDPIFDSSKVTTVFGKEDYGYYWSGTTHEDLMSSPKPHNAAMYVAFGTGLGQSRDGRPLDAHGAGCQRSDPKDGPRSEFPKIDVEAPQGDDIRVYNLVRLVRYA